MTVADRTQYIIVANTQSLCSVVMYGKGITSGSQIIERALSSIREFMEDDGQAFVYQRFVAPSSGSVRFANALDRSTTGSMNELIKFAKLWLGDGELFDLAVNLAQAGALVPLNENERKTIEEIAEKSDPLFPLHE